MLTKKQCQPKSNVNQKTMSTKKQCQPKSNVNQKAMSTKKQCQQKSYEIIDLRWIEILDDLRFDSRVNLGLVKVR